MVRARRPTRRIATLLLRPRSLGEDVPRGIDVAVVFETPIKDGAAAAAVEVPGRAIWARLEGLSYQVGVHFEDSPEGLGSVLAALS